MTNIKDAVGPTPVWGNSAWMLLTEGWSSTGLVTGGLGEAPSPLRSFLVLSMILHVFLP